MKSSVRGEIESALKTEVDSPQISESLDSKAPGRVRLRPNRGFPRRARLRRHPP
jgi:hypothetical protein